MPELDQNRVFTLEELEGELESEEQAEVQVPETKYSDLDVEFEKKLKI
jgi:hypothetical protein